MLMNAITAPDAPAALGPYSQAVRVAHTVYLSGQLGLDPTTGQLAVGVEAQTHQALRNLGAVARAAGGGIHDIARLTILMKDLNDFAQVNAIMERYFKEPFPARTTCQVAALPKSAAIEIDAILTLRAAADEPRTGWREVFDQGRGQ